MKSNKLIVSMLSVAVCGLFAFSIGLQAQSSKNLTLKQGTPMADVAKFETAFIEGLNKGPNPNAKGAQVVATRIMRDFFDHYAWDIPSSARLQKGDPVKLSDSQLREFKSLVKSRFDAAIKSKTTTGLGEGQINKDFFTGKLPNPEKINPDRKALASE